MNNIYIVIHHPYNKLKMFFESEGTLRQHILQTVFLSLTNTEYIKFTAKTLTFHSVLMNY